MFYFHSIFSSVDTFFSPIVASHWMVRFPSLVKWSLPRVRKREEVEVWRPVFWLLVTGWGIT